MRQRFYTLVGLTLIWFVFGTMMLIRSNKDFDDLRKYTGRVEQIWTDISKNLKGRPTDVLLFKIQGLNQDKKVSLDKVSNYKLYSGTSDSTLRGHPFTFYIKHNQIPQVCKDMFKNFRQPTDEADVLSLLDSIFTTNDETRPFYFLTITRTMSKADGAYAEPLGMMGKQFVETRTKDFVEYFKDERILTDKDFEEWAKTVAGEIQISSEGQEKDKVERLLSKMKSNCVKCSKGQIKLIEDFVERVRYHCP